MSDDVAMVTNRLCVRTLSVSWKGGGTIEGRREGYISSDLGFCRLPVLLFHSCVTFAGG